MTAKKKRKKLINCSYPGFHIDPVVPQKLSVQCIQPLWARALSVGFDECPVPGDGDPGGDVSTISSATKTVSNNEGGDESTFWVTEEQIGQLDQGFIRFVKRLLGRDFLSKSGNEDVKCLTFTSRVGTIAQEKEIKWQVVKAKKSTIYVQIDSAAFPEGSRSSFVDLLDYAEEELECSNVVICFPVEHDHRDVIVKTFMFLGFAPLKPGNPLIPTDEEGASKFMYMGYVIG